MEQLNIKPEIIYTATATAGGIAKYLHEYVKTGNFAFGMLLANIGISTFSGYMFASFSSFLGLESQIAYSMAGLGGFMGVRALNFIEDVLRKRNNVEKVGDE